MNDHTVGIGRPTGAITKALAGIGGREENLAVSRENYAALVDLLQVIDASVPDVIHSALGQGLKLT
ncbi:MAG: hypothetical protein V1816_05990, partial [Pseudomonadota bacterium]